jgi:hypothetical protein
MVGTEDLDEIRRDTTRYVGKGEAFAPIDECGFDLYDYVIDRFGFDLGWQMLRPYQ